MAVKSTKMQFPRAGRRVRPSYKEQKCAQTHFLTFWSPEIFAESTSSPRKCRFGGFLTVLYREKRPSPPKIPPKSTKMQFPRAIRRVIGPKKNLEGKFGASGDFWMVFGAKDGV